MPMPKGERKCFTCSYFDKQDDSDFGLCRIERPRVFMDEEQEVYTAFPTVDGHEYCGEGCWVRHSDITGDQEEYYWLTEELNWEEEEKLDQDLIHVWYTKDGKETKMCSRAAIKLSVRKDIDRKMLKNAITDLWEKLDESE